MDHVMQLRCQCNNYPWGNQGSKSLSARLCAQTPGTDFKIDENQYYAEMWMGTYPVLPAYVLKTGEMLQDVLDKHTELIGDSVIKKFGHTQLPYLPKILSIAKALPVQVHPNKKFSTDFHNKHPDKFTDPNHKPEIAVALSDFEAFCGWKPLNEVQTLFSTLKPLEKYLPQNHAHFNDETLKRIVLHILKDTDESITETQEALLALPAHAFGKQEYIAKLLPRVQEQYGKDDPGCLVALLTMNYLQMKEGECTFIPADGIHAYLSGDIVECMARSNNVLNVGFMPRPDRDSPELFTSTLSEAPHTPQQAMLPEEPFNGSSNGKSTVFRPPIPEFDMLRTKIQGAGKETVRAIGGPSVMWTTKGKATLKAKGKEYEVKEGYVFFVAANTETAFETQEGLEMWRAFCE